MRLIDADELLQEIEFEYDLDYGETLIDPRDFADAVCDSPTVDAVPVVRCRECRYYAASGATTSFCIHPGGMKFTSDSDYCSRGQRRAIWDNSQLKQQEHPIESTPLNQEERWLKTV